MKKLAIIDFDGTLFPGNSMPYIWKKYGDYGYSKQRYAVAMLKVQRDKFLYRKVFKDEAGWRYQATIHMFNLFVGMKDKVIREFFERIAQDIYDELNPNVLERIEQHKKDGYEIILLSGGFEILLEMIGMKIGADRVKATPFVYDLEGKFTKITKKDPLLTMNGSKKRPYLEAVYYNTDVDWDGSYAYADNITDSEMLKLVGHPVGVNPDQALKACCDENQWMVMI